MDAKKMDSSWVLVEVAKVIYAISSNAVLSLNQMTEATPLPKAPQEIRGIISFRSRLIELLDLRTLLNLKSIPQELEEFNTMINQRFEDHKNWINTLEKCTIEGTTFSLTTDPHQCAFGKWYDNYNPDNANVMFVSAFQKFDTPHKATHQIGIKVAKLLEEGQKKEALKIINETKDTELKQMFKLFDDIKTAFKESRKETTVVIGTENKCLGLAVDQITAIENLSEFDEELLKEALTSTDIISGTAKRKDDSVVLILNDEYILGKYHST